MSLERLAATVARAVGTPASIVLHTLVFLSVLSLGLFGVDWDRGL